MTEKIDFDDGPRCPSCNVPYIRHLGIQGTCAELQRVKERNEELEQCLAWIVTRPETEAGAYQMRKKAVEVLG